MPIRVAVPKETQADERRVALVPDVAARLMKKGFEVLVERDAGASAHFTDAHYAHVGAHLVDDVHRLYDEADIVVTVQPLPVDVIRTMRAGGTVIGFMAPHRELAMVEALRDRRITAFAMELIPRITRAQTMDALSSQATVAGYKAALIGANLCGRFWPMLTTAAGTVRPAKVLILGAGVAGLQAIATARRLGALVEAYDIRRAAREQVESLGAKFLAVEMDAEAQGGYARELTDEEKRREKEMLHDSVAGADVIITTAQIPGRPAPRLLNAEMVGAMKPGSVVVDLAAESGGNCELTRAGETVVHRDIVVYGAVNVPSLLPVHASEMYAKNLFNFVTLLTGNGAGMDFDWGDEVIGGSVLTHQGEVKHEATRRLLTGGHE
jgi:NAD(P) transhydrogenase subunit alpha